MGFVALVMSGLAVSNAACNPNPVTGLGPWGVNSACLSNDGGTTFNFHCPWESSMLVSAHKFLGCKGVKYDCLKMKVDDLLETYANHETAASPPPEGAIPFIKY